MVLARLGGGLLVVGGVLGLGLLAFASSGGSVILGSSDISGLLAGASAAALGIGAGALSLSGAQGPARLTRLGLGLAAVGLLALALTASANVGPDTSPLLLVLLASIPVVVFGAIVTAIALLRSPGRSRLTGLVLMAGCFGVLLHIATGSDLSTLLIAGVPIGLAMLGLFSLAARSVPSSPA